MLVRLAPDLVRDVLVERRARGQGRRSVVLGAHVVSDVSARHERVRAIVEGGALSVGADAQRGHVVFVAETRRARHARFEAEAVSVVPPRGSRLLRHPSPFGHLPPDRVARGRIDLVPSPGGVAVRARAVGAFALVLGIHPSALEMAARCTARGDASDSIHFVANVLPPGGRGTATFRSGPFLGGAIVRRVSEAPRSPQAVLQPLPLEMAEVGHGRGIERATTAYRTGRLRGRRDPAPRLAAVLRAVERANLCAQSAAHVTCDSARGEREAAPAFLCDR